MVVRHPGGNAECECGARQGSGDILLKKGLITEEELKQAREEDKQKSAAAESKVKASGWVAGCVTSPNESGRFEVVAPRYMRAVLLLQRIAPKLFRRGVGRCYVRLVEPRIGARSGNV